MEQVAPPLLLQPTPYKAWGVARRAAPGFVGNYIHDPNVTGWYHYKKQRPSKRARQRIQHKMEKKAAFQQEERHAHRLTSESGYDTTGDTQPSTNKDETDWIKTGTKKLDNNLSNSLENSSLNKLLKDLHRCDVSINRYQATLHQVRAIFHSQD